MRKVQVAMRLTASNPPIDAQITALASTLTDELGTIRNLAVESSLQSENDGRKRKRILRETKRVLSDVYQWNVNFEVISTQTEVNAFAGIVATTLSGASFMASLENNDVGAVLDTSFDVVASISTRNPSAVPVPAPTPDPSPNPLPLVVGPTTVDLLDPQSTSKDSATQEEGSTLAATVTIVVFGVLGGLLLIFLAFCLRKKVCLLRTQETLDSNSDVYKEDFVENLATQVSLDRAPPASDVSMKIQTDEMSLSATPATRVCKPGTPPSQAHPGGLLHGANFAEL
jgi:hypothetical protein